MHALIKDDKLEGYTDYAAHYIDCTAGSSAGPWFSIDTITSSGENTMYGLGVARDRDFNLVANNFMLVYKWKFLDNQTDDDRFFPGCYSEIGLGNRRIIATKVSNFNQIIKP